MFFLLGYFRVVVKSVGDGRKFGLKFSFRYFCDFGGVCDLFKVVVFCFVDGDCDGGRWCWIVVT